jgi:hypothetical protein
MRVRIEPGALHQTKWFEYAIRFVIGGAITVITGILAKSYGPVVGGLFLAFPAILPASATLISKHEKTKNGGSGHESRRRCGCCWIRHWQFRTYRIRYISVAPTPLPLGGPRSRGGDVGMGCGGRLTVGTSEDVLLKAVTESIM